MTEHKVLSLDEATTEAFNSNIKMGPLQIDSKGRASFNFYTGDGKELWIAFPSVAAPISPSRFQLEPDAVRTNIFRDTDSSFDYVTTVPLGNPRTASSALDLPSRKKQRRDKRYKGRG